MSLRIAFTLIGGRNWTGGYNYLLNLLRVLNEQAEEEVHAVLLAGQDVDPVELAPFLEITGCDVCTTSVMDEARRPALQRYCLAFGSHPEVLRILRLHRIDLVFESALFLGWRLPVPAVAWIPDLQHRFLPHLFGRMAWLKRELGFRAQVASGRFIMVSSEDSRLHVERLYPSSAGRVRAVRFAVKPGQAHSLEELQAVRQRHGLPERFFFMPNQFWAHKNHSLVVQALEVLSREGGPPTVVASGKQLDPRDPAHFENLRQRVAGAGLQQAFLMPGLIPYADVHALMQASTALINPSLFEGWSTTVEEARAHGVPMLLSDIPVHREQAGEDAVYFDPHAPADLARRLLEFQPRAPETRARQRESAETLSRERLSRFAQEFLSVARSALA